MTKLFYLTATLGLLVAVPVQAQEQECFAGFSCHEAAEASVSFGIVRDCPATFVIRPDKKARYDKILRAFRSSPQGKGNQQLSSKPRAVAPGLCDGVARKILSGASKIEYLAVKPAAAQRLSQSSK